MKIVFSTKYLNILLFQVIEQCNSFVWKVRDGNDKVNFTLYYETLCPDCRQFIKTELYRAYNSVLDIVNITLVPYGNAHETYQPATQDYAFVCQHGADECLGNLIHVK
jgi:interferon gamma-inducible protein 30